MILPWRRRPRIHVEAEPYAPRSFLRNAAVPPYEDWLPAGIAGRIRLPGYPHPWVMARTMYGDDELGPDAYRLVLPEELRYGGEDDWMVTMPESGFLPGPSRIALLSTRVGEVSIMDPEASMPVILDRPLAVLVKHYLTEEDPSVESREAMAHLRDYLEYFMSYAAVREGSSAVTFRPGPVVRAIRRLKRNPNVGR